MDDAVRGHDVGGDDVDAAVEEHAAADDRDVDGFAGEQGLRGEGRRGDDVGGEELAGDHVVLEDVAEVRAVEQFLGGQAGVGEELGEAGVRRREDGEGAGVGVGEGVDQFGFGERSHEGRELGVAGGDRCDRDRRHGRRSAGSQEAG